MQAAWFGWFKGFCCFKVSALCSGLRASGARFRTGSCERRVRRRAAICLYSTTHGASPCPGRWLFGVAFSMSFLVLSHAGARFCIAQTGFMFALVMALGWLRLSTLLRLLVIAIQPLAQIPEPSTLNPTPHTVLSPNKGTPI